jgi:uncharacterized protein (TIGR03437 family)
MRRLLNTKAIVILVLAFPIAALADVSGTPTLAANSALNLDTGATTASGGDILWNGSSVTPQGNATAVQLGLSGATGFAIYFQSDLETTPGYSKSPITVIAGTLFAVKTNSGNYAKVLVTAKNGTSIALQFTTYESSSGPHITQVLNNYGLIPAGFSNFGIAPGSLFIIKGTGLTDPNAQALPLQSSSGAGLPTTLNGASVKVTVNGTTTVPVFYYAIATQLALVLPSNTGTSTGTRVAAQVTVTYNNQTTGAFPIQVVPSAMGFDAYYGTGSGLGVATNNATGALYDYSNSIPPGTTVVLWGSGLGADPQRDTKYVPAAFPINNLAHVYIGGVDAPIVYQGASGYPGLNQVDVTVPASVPLGCNVSLVGVTAAGMPTNFLTLPIGNGACSDAPFGTSGNQRQSLSGKSTVNTGTVLVLHSTSPGTTSGSTQVNDIAEASFQSISGASYGAASNSVSLGSCIATQTAGGGGGTATGLDAGTISMAGPVGSPVTLNGIPQSPGTYVAQLATGAIPSSGGTFAFHGAAGAQVGAFDTSVVFPNPLLNWTNQDADAGVAQGKALNATWTGGAPNSVVYIGGNSSATVGGETVNGSFLCLAPVSAQQFTVPAYVLAALPLGSGNLYMENITKYQSFAASGLDAGYAFGGVQYTINWTYRSNVAAKKASGQ